MPPGAGVRTDVVHTDEEIARRRRQRTIRRLGRDVIEICVIVLVAFAFTYLVLKWQSDSKGGTIDANTVFLVSLTIACIAGWVASVAVLIPGGSDDIRDRED